MRAGPSASKALDESRNPKITQRKFAICRTAQEVLDQQHIVLAAGKQEQELTAGTARVKHIINYLNNAQMGTTSGRSRNITPPVGLQSWSA